MASPKPATEPKLDCPYTGETLVLTVVGNGLAVAHTFRGGLDPLAPTATKDELEDRLRMRRGRPGVVSPANLKCPFRGGEIELVSRTADGVVLWYARGVWTPRALFSSAEVARYEVSYRKGIAPAFSRETIIQRSNELVQNSDVTEGMVSKEDGYSEAVVDSVIKE